MGRTVGELLVEGRRRLGGASFGASTREAGLLLGWVLGVTEARLLARPEEVVAEEEAGRFRGLLERRLRGEPVAYLVGEREFWGRRFRVDRRVLIPRPESEHLIEAALELALPAAPRIVDVGTGSGCLAVTLAREIADARVVALDSSPAALAVAAANAGRHGVAGRVRTAAMDLALGLDPRAVDLVVSNPPYIDPGEAAALSPEVRDFEPAAALFAPDSGDSVLARLLDELSRLRSGTPLLLEIGHDQGPRVAELAAAGPWELAEIRRDLAGRDRIAVIRRS